MRSSSNGIFFKNTRNYNFIKNYAPENQLTVAGGQGLGAGERRGAEPCALVVAGPRGDAEHGPGSTVGNAWGLRAGPVGA